MATAAPASSALILNDKDKKNQGLRQFSLRVCRQVEAKMTTTYNEVADELVKEFKDEETDSDEKNIRRYGLEMRDLAYGEWWGFGEVCDVP